MISTEDVREQFAGSGTTGPFTYPYLFLADSHLVVIKTDSSGLDTTLTLTTDYTVTGAGDAGGGEVTLVVALAVGEKLTVYRSPPYTQGSDYITSGKFKADVVEGDLDKVVMLAQGLRDKIERCLQLAASTDLTVDVNLPAPESSKFLSWNAAANALINAAGTTDVVVSTFMETLLDDENASAALTTLGITEFIKTLMDDADAATAVATLGFTATVEEINAAMDGILASYEELNNAAYGIGATIPRQKVLAIGAWDMDATAVKSVTHGLDLEKIVGCRAIVEQDVSGTKYDIDYAGAGYYFINSSEVRLERIGGGTFDSTSFDDTGSSRGWVIVDYID